jgi:hypothetical protein
MAMIQPPPGGGGDDPNERLPRQHEIDALDFYPTTDEEGEETVAVALEERSIPPAPDRPSIFANRRSGSPRNLDLFQPQNNNAHNFMNLMNLRRVDIPPPPPSPIEPPEQDETEDRPDEPPPKKKKKKDSKK